MSASLPLDSVPEILRPALLALSERLAGRADWPALLEALPEARRRELPRLLAASEFAGAVLIQDPHALTWVGERHEPGAARRAAADYESRVAAASLEEGQRLLREWRRRALLRIAWRDLAGDARIEETLADLSGLAEACVRAAAGCARAHLSGLFGEPRGADGGSAALIVLAMGKLGGGELNFSSDIDLVFLYSARGTTDGARMLDNEEYFTRLGRELIRLLDARTDDGIVFRLDLRLRPFGDSGPLVISLAALEEYLQQHGRDWERYAWIKARPLIGAHDYETTQAECVRPFVYRRYLDFGVFDSLREMKALIEREVARRELEDDLKLGRGGIRELEFIVQSLQLVRGGSDRRLQTPSLLTVLPLLADSKLLTREELEALIEAYRMLRKAENAVQMIRDEQTHRLPVDPLDRARLYVALGAPDWPSALARIDAARAVVASQFQALIFGGRVRAEEGSGVLAWLDSEEIDLAEELAALGVPAPQLEAVAALLEAYRRGAPYRRLDEVGRRRVHVILDRLLAASTRQSAAGAVIVIGRVLGVLEAIGARSSYLALLKEQPAALERLIEVCAESGFLARQIADFPLLLDELIDAKALEELPSRAGFERQIAARMERVPSEDPERQVEGLRQFQKVAVFGVALADLTGRLPLMRVSDRLTDIAELILECCMGLAWRQMTRAYGVPCCGVDEAHARVVRVAVAGYGKLGGLELGYGSDLDLVFLHDSSGEWQQTRGEKPIDNGLFFLRLGQRIVHLLTMHSAAGRLYEVDMRLRPNGKGGFLMTGIEAFERYQMREAWTWEHQALLRARAVAGDAELRAQFEAIRRSVLSSAVRRERLRADVIEMRRRMRRELSQARAGEFDLKQDEGGLADIEFLVQYLVLSSAAAHPELLTYSDNVRQLEGLARVAVLDPATAGWLKEVYIGYRTVLHHQSLEDGPRVVEASVHAQVRERVRAIWRETLEAQAP
jgi:glutamate-ammonia-ligase adenylyltransferase